MLVASSSVLFHIASPPSKNHGQRNLRRRNVNLRKFVRDNLFLFILCYINLKILKMKSEIFR